MSDLNGFDWLVLTVVVLALILWAVRFVRRNLAARCSCDAGSQCSSCSGCAGCGRASDGTAVRGQPEVRAVKICPPEEGQPGKRAGNALDNNKARH